MRTESKTEVCVSVGKINTLKRDLCRLARDWSTSKMRKTVKWMCFLIQFCKLAEEYSNYINIMFFDRKANEIVRRSCISMNFIVVIAMGHNSN